MGGIQIFLFSTIILISIVLYSLSGFFELFVIPEKPIIEDVWWGNGEPTTENHSVLPFKINISQGVLDDLQFRLEHTRRITKPLVDDQWYGMNGDLAVEILEYWKNEYNWRAREKYLNKFPHFTTNIQGLNIHFLHVKPQNISKNIKILPLLMLHGWPSSSLEFYDIIPILTTSSTKRDFVFEVIVSDLPGFAFSEPATKPGFGPVAASLVYKKLMDRLGFQKYYVHGGDFGSLVLHAMAVNFEESVLGFHNTMCVSFRPYSILKMIVGSLYPKWIGNEEHQKLVYPLSGLISLMNLELGYLHLQATKPDTVGIALNDSPIGLASYHIEKWMTGTDWSYRFRRDGGLTEFYTYDKLIDQVMVCWINHCATTSNRIYAEVFNKREFPLLAWTPVSSVPVACSRNKYDFVAPDGTIGDTYYNLIQVTDMHTGHFPAFQKPNELASDIFNAIQKMEKMNSKNE